MNTRRLELLVIISEFVSFLLALAVIWADEYLDAPHYLFGTAPSPARGPEYFFESGTIFFLGFMTMATTVVLFRRIRKLESFVVICAWCNKVKVEDEWMPVTRYLSHHQDKKPSHGVCPACSANLLNTVPDPEKAAAQSTDPAGKGRA